MSYEVGYSTPLVEQTREPKVLGALASLQEVSEKLQQRTAKLFTTFQKVLRTNASVNQLKAESKPGSKPGSDNSQLSDMLYEVYAKLDCVLEQIKELEDRCDV